MSVTYCVVEGCGSKLNEGLSFFRCPLDEARCRVWKNILGFTGSHRYANITLEQSHSRIRICGLHFGDDSFANEARNRLHKFAIPSLKLGAGSASDEGNKIKSYIRKDVGTQTEICTASVGCQSECSNQIDMDVNMKLVAIVKEYPMLYDSSMPQGSVEQKQDLWREITQRLKDEPNPDAQTVYEVKQRWKNLRDSYVKDVKLDHLKRKNKNIKTSRRPYRYSKYMTFLQPYVLKKGSKLTLQHQTKESAVCSDGENLTRIKQEPDEEVMFEEPIIQNDTDESSQMTFDSDPTTNSSDRFEEIDSFFKGIADVAKTLSPINQIYLQRDVANMVFDLKLKELQKRDADNDKEDHTTWR
ncbi:uncharacterized protein LOC132705568 [Cylas formicarius]|uniref:uncharacterized protein LOC132705568 n=1 Tax=Cylas formicarius TaxID=197179 RepID=UPI002958B660|nr:uncharacterized protein LOC132705568 [Cylas formicarius]